jgi:LysM repeat protein
MKRILVWVFILSLTIAAARAQEDATQQQINELNGRIQSLQETLDVQKTRISALEKEISDLRDKSSSPGAPDTASADDLKKLADQIQEIDKKRQADKELILKEIEKLGKVGGGSAASHKPAPTVSTTATENTSPGPAGPQKGYDYTIQRGDTLLAIAKAYRDQGIKVTTDQIIKANPGLDPKSLIVGKKIFIPAPAQ